MNKREAFKFLIKEFHESPPRKPIDRDLRLPDTGKIVSLVGSRRSGKTSYFFQLINEWTEKIPLQRIVYLNFEDDRILPLTQADLKELLEAYYELYPESKGERIFFFFDEIQNIEGWETFVRRVADKENAGIFVTGSSSRLLSREIATALRGRTLTYYMLPLSFREFLRFKSIEAGKDSEYSAARYRIKKGLDEYLAFGGFPEVVLEKPELREKILGEYFELAIHRDLADRFSIRNTSALKALTKHLITNLACLFSVNAYARSTGTETPVAKDTIMEYLGNLEDVNLIHFTQKFDYSLKAQRLNPKKAYCVDNGLRNAVAFKFSGDEGKLAENAAFLELKRRGKEVYYWKNAHEVDLVIKNRDHTLEAVNVSFTNEISERETKGLQEFKQKFAKTKTLTLITKDVEKNEDGIAFIPLWKWLLA